MTAEQCNRCRFWHEDMEVRDPNDENFGFGRCRLRPPTLSEVVLNAVIVPPSYREQVDGPEFGTTDLQRASLHPVTFATDWCGQFAVPPCTSIRVLAEGERLPADLARMAA